MFSAEHRVVVVVGAQWGDEGKGKVVDILSETADLVVRYQGGANAGHTVVIEGNEFILHQIPTGILHPTPRCVVGNGVVVNPQTLLEEIGQLESRGVRVAQRLMLSDRAQVVLPYHLLLDGATERSQKIGTTRRGIGPAYEDKFGRRGIRLGDLERLDQLLPVVRRNVDRANKLLELLGSAERADYDEHDALLQSLIPRIQPMIADTGQYVSDRVKAGDNVLLEGAQGAMLDVDHGTYPFVTSSNTTAGGAAVGAGIGPTAIDAVLGVIKAYATRVGNGPLPSEAEGAVGDRLRELGGEYGATTGRPRRCGWFDAVAGRYAARINGLTHLAVTKLDVLDTFARIPICVGYRVGTDVLETVPADLETMDCIQPVYEEVEGWQSGIGSARRLSDLPRQARAYLERIETLLDVPVGFVSVGTSRDQFIRTS